MIKLEEEPTPPKAGRLVAGSPDVIVLGGLGGEMLLEELRRGSHGTMTGFGFPEVLVAVVRRWFAGDRGRRGRDLRPLRDADPVREPGAAQPADPQARLPAAGRDRRRDGPAPGVPADPGTLADLDDVLRRTGLDAHLAAGSVLPSLLA